MSAITAAIANEISGKSNNGHNGGRVRLCRLSRGGLFRAAPPAPTCSGLGSGSDPGSAGAANAGLFCTNRPSDRLYGVGDASDVRGVGG
jgi:hypothetical protein